MEITVRKCDNCGKATEHHYEEKRWLRIKIGTIRENQGAKIKFLLHRADLPLSYSKEYDFCNFTCFHAWLKKVEKGDLES